MKTGVPNAFWSLLKKTFRLYNELVKAGGLLHQVSFDVSELLTVKIIR